MVQKRILVSQRLRRPPATGWSWVDRRFVREHAEHLSREAVLLYFFLAAVGDRHGLSFYSDSSIGLMLRLRPEVVSAARHELIERDLIAYEAPLAQVLSIREQATRRAAAPGQGLVQLGELFRQIGERPATGPSETRRTP